LQISAENKTHLMCTQNSKLLFRSCFKALGGMVGGVRAAISEVNPIFVGFIGNLQSRVSLRP
jgi:hypothetical protein